MESLNDKESIKAAPFYPYSLMNNIVNMKRQKNSSLVYLRVY
jgi:hypothetical protein